MEEANSPKKLIELGAHPGIDDYIEHTVGGLPWAVWIRNALTRWAISEYVRKLGEDVVKEELKAQMEVLDLEGGDFERYWDRVMGALSLRS